MSLGLHFSQTDSLHVTSAMEAHNLGLITYHWKCPFPYSAGKEKKTQGEL